MECHPRSCQTPQLFNSNRNILGGPIKTFVSVFNNVIVLFLVLCCEYLRIKSLFFYLHDVMKTVGGVKIP